MNPRAAISRLDRWAGGLRLGPRVRVKARGQTSFLDAPASAEALARQFELWRGGIAYEVEFWERWHATRGAEWPDEYLRRLQPDREIQDYVVAGVIAAAPEKTRVLDVGAGPVSRLGPCWQGRRLDIVAVDPLAPFYDAIAGRHGAAWPIRTIQGFAEDLGSQFAPGEFDAVYCSNALDHSIDPLRGLEEMLIVTRVGGRITLEHAPNEAERENYDGFHQWNLDLVDDEFWIWNRDASFDMNALLAPFARLESRRTDRRLWITLIKSVDLGLDFPRRRRERLHTALAAMTLTFGPKV